jgi:hypothetical protein
MIKRIVKANDNVNAKDLSLLQRQSQKLSLFLLSNYLPSGKDFSLSMALSNLYNI